MTENNKIDIPVLTLNPASLAKDKAELETAAAQMEMSAEPSAQAVAEVASEAVEQMDTSMLTEEEIKAIEAFVDQIDVNNTDHVLLYGAEAQKKISDFSDSALEAVRTCDTGEVGDMLVKLVGEIRGFAETAEKPKGLGGLFWNAKKAIGDMTVKYDEVEANVNTIATALESHQIQLLKDVAMFNRLYDMNTQYFKELTMYIVAGEKKLAEVRATALQELKDKATASGDAMDAQKANDLATNCDRFEKKLHDLKLTRQVALQMAPQIRLLQNNDSLLVERIQSTLSNTLPLWKSQMVIALGMHRSQEALKMGTIETAREAERGVIDLETLVSTNQSLIDTINEVMKIQDEGRTQRLTAEKQMIEMENHLKAKLLELKH